MAALIKHAGSWAVNSFLSDWLDGVTPDTFIADFGAGEFGVKNLQLNLKRFQEIETPVEIKHVSLGNVRLTIPALWKLLKSPIKVKVEKLFIVVGPSNVSRFTIDERKARMKATKKLALFVMGFINGAPTPPEYANRKEKSDKRRKILTSPELFGLPGILKKLVPIVDNAQIEVANIHIRYEDAISKPTNPFAVGLCLDSIAIRGSTTAQGDDAFITEWNIDNFRKVFLNNFSLYIDTEGKGAAQLANAATKPRMNDLVYRGHSAPNAYSEEHEFLIQPLSLGARAQWHRGYDLKIPMADINASIPHVGLTISHTQYTRALDAASHYNNYAARLKFGYLAPPQESAKTNPRAWWRYVIGCVLRRVRHRMKRYKPERVFQRLTDRTVYINLWREREHLGTSSLTASDKSKMDEIELSLKYRDIIQFRKMAKLSIMRDKQTGRIPKFSFITKAPAALKLAAFFGIVTLISLLLLIFLPSKTVATIGIVLLAAGLVLGSKFFFFKPSMLPFDESQDSWNWIFHQLGQNTGIDEDSVPVPEQGEPIFPCDYSLVTFNANIPRVQLDVDMFGTRPYDSSILTLAIDGIHATGSIGIPSIYVKASVDTINAVERVSLPKRMPLHVLCHNYPRNTIEYHDDKQNIDSSYKDIASTEDMSGFDVRNRKRHLEALGRPTDISILIDRVDVSKLILGAVNRLHETSDELVQRRFLNVDVALQPNEDLDVGVKVVTTTFNMNASIPFINAMMGFFTPQKNKAEIREMTHAASLKMAVQTIDSVKNAIRNRQVIALDIAFAGPTIVFAQSYTPGVEADAVFVRLGPVSVASNPTRATDVENWTEDDCYDLYKVDARHICLTMQQGIWHDVNTARRISAAMTSADTHVHSDINMPSLRTSSVAIEDLSDVDTALHPLLNPKQPTKDDDDKGTSTDDDDSDVEFSSDDSEPETPRSKPLSPRPSIEEPGDHGHKEEYSSASKHPSKHEASSSAPSDDQVRSSPRIDKVKDKNKKKEKKEKKHKHADGEKKKRKRTKHERYPSADGPSSPKGPRIEEPLEPVVEKPLVSSNDDFVVTDDSYVMKPMSVSLKAFVCVAGSVVGMSATKLDGNVTPLDIIVSPSRLTKILAICMAQFPPLTAKRVKKVAHEPLFPQSYTPAAPPGVADSSSKVRRKRSIRVGHHTIPHGNIEQETPSGSPSSLRNNKPITYYEEIEVPAGRFRKKNERMYIERQISMETGDDAKAETERVTTIVVPTATADDAKAAVARGEIPPQLASSEATEDAKREAQKAAELDAEYAQSLQEVIDAAAEVAEQVDRPDPGQEPHHYAPICDLDDVSGFEKYQNLKLPDFRPLLLGTFQLIGVSIHICQDADSTDLSSLETESNTLHKTESTSTPRKAKKAAVKSTTTKVAASVFGKRTARTIAKLIVGPIAADVNVGPFISSISAKVSFVHLEEFVDETFKIVPEKSSKMTADDRSFVLALDHPEYGALALDMKIIPRDSPVFSDTLTDLLVNVGKLDVNVRRPALLILTKLAVSCIPSNFVLPAFGVHPAMPMLKLSDLPSVGLEEELEAHNQRTTTFAVTDRPHQPPNVPVDDKVKADGSPVVLEGSETESSTTQSAVARPASPANDSSSGEQARPHLRPGKDSASSSPHRVPSPTAAAATTDVATAASNAAQATDTSPEATDSNTTDAEVSTKQGSKVVSPIPIQKAQKEASTSSAADASSTAASPSTSAQPSGRIMVEDDVEDDTESVPVSARSYEDGDETDADADEPPPQDLHFGMPLSYGTVGGADLQPIFIEVEPDDGVVENLREKEATRALVVRANLPSARFHLMQESTKLLSLAVTNVIVCLDIRGDQKLVVQGRVNRISVDAAHEGIGGINMIALPHEEAKLLDFKFGMTPSSCTDYAGHDMLIACEIAQIRATYYHVVVMSLVAWSTNFLEPLIVLMKPLKAPIKLTREARAARRAYRKTLVAAGDDYMLRMSAQNLPRGSFKKHHRNKSANDSLMITQSLLDNIVLPKAVEHDEAANELTHSVYDAMSIDAMPVEGVASSAKGLSVIDYSVDPPALIKPNQTMTIMEKKKTKKTSKKSSAELDESSGLDDSGDESLVSSSAPQTPSSSSSSSSKSKKSKKSKKISPLLPTNDGDDNTSDDSDVGTPLPSARSDSATIKKKRSKKLSRERSGSSVEGGDLDHSEESSKDSRRHSIAGLPLDSSKRRHSTTSFTQVPEIPTDADSDKPTSPRKKASRRSIKRSESSSSTKSKNGDGKHRKKKKKKSQEEEERAALKKPKIKIDAVIASPILIIPVNPEDVEKGGYLEVHAGRIELENEILVAGNALITDTLEVSLTHMHMVFHMPESVQTASTITLMDHTGLKASIQRVLGGDKDHSLPIIGIDLEMLPVHISFGTPQLNLIFHLLGRHIMLPIPTDYEVTQYIKPLSTDVKSYFDYEQRMLAALEVQERVTAWRSKHPDADPLNPNDAYAAMRISVRILHFALDICDSHMTPQMRIDVRQLGALVKVHSDGFTAVEAALQSVGVLDTVISIDHFNTLFGKPVRISDPMCQLAFVLNPGANTLGIKGAVHSPTIVLMPETMLRLRNTWEDTIMHGLEGLKELNTGASNENNNFSTSRFDANESEAKKSASKREEVPNMMPTIKLGVLISSPMIAIVPAANSCSTPAFTVDLGEIVINIDMEPQRKFVAATLGISNLRAIRSFLTAGTLQSTDEQYLLHPMELKSSAIINGPKINISAVLPLVQFITSFRDVSLIMRIVEAYTPLIEAIGPPKGKRARGILDQSSSTNGGTTASTAASSVDALTDLTDDSNSPSDSASSVPDEEKQTIAAAVEITAIDIAVIDDRFKGDFFVPIFRSTLGPLHGRFNMLDQRMEGTFGFKNVTASVYNRPYGGWEPTLEPWEMSAGFQKDSHGINVRMVAEQHLEFTVNHALLEAVFELLEIVIPPTAESAAQRKKRRKQALQPTLDPLVIRNFTGVPVTVQLKEVSEPFEVGSGESRPLLMKRMTRADVIAKPPRYTFSVFVQGASAPAKLNATRVDTMIVPYILEDPDSIYVAEVETEQGSRIITIRGTYKVRNVTSTAIEIMLTKYDGSPLYAENPGVDENGKPKERKPQIITVEPNGGTFCASVVQSATRAVRVRTLGYEWSDCIQFTQPKPSYILHCKERQQSDTDSSRGEPSSPRPEASKSTENLLAKTAGCDWYATARVDVTNEGDDYTLVVAPPINVENLTTVPLQVKFVNIKKEKQAMKTIAREEKESLKASAKEREKEREKRKKEGKSATATDDSVDPTPSIEVSIADEKTHSRMSSVDQSTDRTISREASSASFATSSEAPSLHNSTASAPKYESAQQLHTIPTWDVIECDDEDVHQLPSFDETLAICVKMPDYGWSKPLPFVTKVESKRTDKFDSDIVISKTVEVPDLNGHLLKIGVDVATTDTSARNVKIFARAWIVNDTGLPVFFKKDRDEKSLAAGQHNFKGYDMRIHADGHKREMKEMKDKGGALPDSSSAHTAGLKSRLESPDQSKWYENPSDLIAEVPGDDNNKGTTTDDPSKAEEYSRGPDFAAPTINNVSSARELRKAAKARLDAELASTHYRDTGSHIRENFSSRSISPGYGPYYYYGEKRVSIALENSSWSSSSDLGVRDEGTIDLEDSHTGRLYSFFISVAPGPARFWRTSIVRIYPRFVVSNSSPFPLILRQISEPHDAPTVLRLEAGQMLPYHWSSHKRSQKMAAHIADRPHLCTAYFSLDEVGRFPLRFHDTKLLAPIKHGKRAICAPSPIPSNLDDNLFFSGLHITNMGDSSIFVRFLDDAPDEYYTISNQTSSEIVIREYQSDSKLAKLHIRRTNEGASLASSMATIDQSGLDNTEDDVSEDLLDNDDDSEVPAGKNDGANPSSTADDSNLTDKEKKARAKEAAKRRKEEEKAARKSAKEAAKESAKDAKILTPNPGDESIGTATNTTYDDTSAATMTIGGTHRKKKKHSVPIEVDEEEGDLRGAQIYIMKPKRKEAFMFPRPQHSKHKIQFQLAGDATWHNVNLDKIKQKPSVKLADRRYMHIRTVAVGQSKQLIIKIASKEAKTDEEQLAAAADGLNLKFEVLMAGCGVSFVDEKPQELMYARMSGLQVNMGMNSLEQNLEVKLGMMQVDNCLYSTPHTVVAHSLDQPDAEPFFHLSLVRDMRYQKFFCFRYFSMKMHKLSTKLDMAFAMNALVWGLKLTKWVGERTAAEVEQKAILGEGEGKIKTPAVSATSNGFYFEVFHLNPMSFLISFVPSSNFDCPTADDASAAMIASIAPHLMTINEAPLFLGGLLLTNCFTSQDEFIERIMAHYIKSVLKQLLMLAGSADALGNPVSLVNSLGNGVYDLVHEPAAGATESPAKFGIGLAKGAGSMVKNSLGALLASAEKIVGNVSKLGEKVSMDKEYQQDRERMKMKRANHVGVGLGLGLKELGTGLFQGVAGVVISPVKGARSGGIKGFAAGIGKGLVGVVVKPTVGVVDLVTRTTEGIRNTGSDVKNVERVRDPRFIGSDRLLPTYDAYKAEGQRFLRTINDGRYKREFYAWHKAPAHHAMVIVTNTRIMYLKYHTINKVVSSGNHWSVKWREQLLVFSEVISRDDTRSKLILSAKDDSENHGNTLALSKSAKPPTADEAPAATENSGSEKTSLSNDKTSTDKTDKTSTDKSSSSSSTPSKKDKPVINSGGSSTTATPGKDKNTKDLIRSPSTKSNDSSSATAGPRIWKIKYNTSEDAEEMVEQLVFYIQEAPVQRPRAKALSLLRSFNPKLLLGHKRKATKRDLDTKEAKEAKKAAKKALKSSQISIASSHTKDNSEASDDNTRSKLDSSTTTSSSSDDSPSAFTALSSPLQSKHERRKSITSPGIPEDGKEKKREKLSRRAETDAPVSSSSALATPEEKKRSKRHSRTLTADNTDTSDADTSQRSPRKDKKEKKSKTPRSEDDKNQSTPSKSDASPSAGWTE